MVAARWRKERLTKPTGLPAWYLKTGSRTTGITSLGLGRLAEGDAQRALERIQAEADGGTVDRVLALWERDRDACRAYLLDDGDGLVLPDAVVVWAKKPIRAYFETVFAAARAADRPKSWRTERGLWPAILDSIGSIRLGDLDPRDVAEHLDGLTKRDGTPVSGNTKRLHRAAVQALVNHAYRARDLDARLDLSDGLRIAGSTKRTREPAEPLDLEELLALLRATARPHHRAMFAVGAGMGLRPSELIRVRWEDIDWEARTLAVRGSKTADASAVVPLTPVAFEEARAWWMRCGQPAAGVAFPARKDGTPYPDDPRRPSPYRRALATAARNAGIERSVSPYLLRHSFATIAWSVGIEKDVARRIMRHTDDTMLDRVYARPRPRELAERLRAFSFGG